LIAAAHGGGAVDGVLHGEMACCERALAIVV
jgi:hypothetical protein